jgi:hypothetical protein
MKNIVRTTPKTGRMTCAWVPTGNPRTPLACVWTDAESPLAASRAEPSPADDAAGAPSLRVAA